MSRNLLAALLAACLGAGAAAYEGAIHQQLTFVAAQHYNRCAEGTHLQRLTPLQVRYVAKANANQADRPWWQRLFRWNYYDRSGRASGRVLWLLETRMHFRFRGILERLERTGDLSRRFSSLGSVVNYVQDATTPTHVAPVFTARWWRFSVNDRFSSYPVDADALSAALAQDCVAARAADGSFEALLANTAERTVASILAPVRGMPATWEAFWELDKDDDDFGSYGVAGNNFGRETAFRCPGDRERRCVLLDNDPLYVEYAQARHLHAVRATIAALAMMQQRLQTSTALEPDAPPTAQAPKQPL